MKANLPTDQISLLLRLFCLLFSVMGIMIISLTDKVYIGLISFILTIFFLLLTIFGKSLFK